MATKPFKDNNDDDSDPFVIRRTWSSEDENTAVAGSNRSENGKEEREILVKWQMPGNLTPSDAKKQIAAILTELLLCFPGEVVLIDHNSREWVFMATDDEEKFTTDMEKEVATKLYPIRDKNQRIIKWVVITKFLSAKEIHEWKDHEHFYTTVQEAKTYMIPHPFKYTEWDISSIGFIQEIHVAHYTQAHLHDMIKQTIEKQEKQHPTFQLIPQRITNKDKTATTRAYTIQCAKSDAKQLIHLMTHGDFRAKPLLIPFKYKTSQPDIFTQCIRKQNEVYHKTWVIKLAGITPQSMDYIKDEILGFAGVFHVVPTRRISEVGEWKILVDHTKCAYIHRQMTNKWQSIISKIPPDVLASSPITFSSPMISSQKVRSYQDESSDTDSYGSILTTGTDISAGLERFEEADHLNEPPPQYSYPSYASAAATSTTSQESMPMSSPTASYTDWQSEKRDLEAQIRQQTIQIEKIQADLDARVSRTQDLEEQLAQAIELAHSRDARHEEMLQKFEQLMAQVMDTNVAPRPPPPPPPPGTTETQVRQITPTTRPMTTHSPPPKKNNHSSTPPKTMYPVFRQIDKDPPRFKRPQALLTQPMDTDDSNSKPTPGVTAGTQVE